LSQEWDELLAPVDEVAPAGADPALSDPLFQAVVQAARGHTDYQFDGKNEVEFYRPPNWSEVKRQVLDCLGRSRDIRLAIILVRALTAEAGPAGLARGLSYVERLLAGFWDTAHPAPDPSESTPAKRYFTRINELCSKLVDEG
jgi:type VI secretion system protein ImpA